MADLEKLLEKKKELEKRIRLEKSALAKAERGKDTRRKILIGAYIHSRDDMYNHIVNSSDFNQYITRVDDRKLFGFNISEIQQKHDSDQSIEQNQIQEQENKSIENIPGSFKIEPDSTDL